MILQGWLAVLGKGQEMGKVRKEARSRSLSYLPADRAKLAARGNRASVVI
ncbi:hypothetical protein [Euhalothece natronophila]|nr:hypothetical protein [Euhalothece natronophila]